MKYFLPLLLLIMACSKEKQADEAPSCTELNDTTAIYYYTLRTKGDFDRYVASMQSCANQPPEYKQRIVNMLRHHQAEINKHRKGISHVEVVRTERHARDSMANAFLSVTFNDSTREEVMLPLVYHEGKWMIQ